METNPDFMYGEDGPILPPLTAEELQNHYVMQIREEASQLATGLAENNISPSLEITDEHGTLHYLWSITEELRADVRHMNSFVDSSFIERPHTMVYGLALAADGCLYSYRGEPNEQSLIGELDMTTRLRGIVQVAADEHIVPAALFDPFNHEQNEDFVLDFRMQLIQMTISLDEFSN